MKSSTSDTLDVLIKKIYKSYIDIKTEEFDEISVDILLGDIKQLYTVVKNIGRKDYLEEDFNEKFEKEVAIMSKKDNEIPVEIDLPTNDIEKKESNELPIVEEEIALKKENVSEIVSERMETPSLDTPIIINNKESNISTTNLEIVNPEIPTVETPNSINLSHQEHSVNASITNTTLDNTETSQEPILSASSEEAKTLSSTKIIDFLHQDDTPTREIYDFIDINSRIGLTEIFFKGNSVVFSECLKLLNQCPSKEQSVEIIKQYAVKNNIDLESDIFNIFKNIIDRKFLFLK